MGYMIATITIGTFYIFAEWFVLDSGLQTNHSLLSKCIRKLRHYAQTPAPAAEPPVKEPDGPSMEPVDAALARKPFSQVKQEMIDKYGVVPPQAKPPAQNDEGVERWQKALANKVEPVDDEVIPLCDALNALPGIETISSCCGHGYAPFRVYFTAANLDSLRPILEAIDESEIWRLRVSMATGNMEIYVALDGQKESYTEANSLAAKLQALAAKEQA